MSKYQSSIVTNQDTEDLSQALIVYYCLCGEYALIIEKSLETLPVRPTDHSIVINNTNYIYTLSAQKGQPVIIQRNENFEKQYRYYCTRCRLPIAYDTVQVDTSYHSSVNNSRHHRHNKTEQKAPYTYIMPDALVLKQGLVPDIFAHELESTKNSG
ncbi:hypothetical protein BB561_006129 [Smittium simulii]|uniref:STEEP1 domain-containing protein n=1 Tax=Smittium simulii TaxID=133385 RepID=A0A2T9Y6H6_9FUNG|nr:hypothetical protein BB561_006129 [Smittium simulii]